MTRGATPIQSYKKKLWTNTGCFPFKKNIFKYFFRLHYRNYNNTTMMMMMMMMMLMLMMRRRRRKGG